MLRHSLVLFIVGLFSFLPFAEASTNIPFTVNLSEAVIVTGTPRVAIDVS